MAYKTERNIKNRTEADRVLAKLSYVATPTPTVTPTVTPTPSVTPTLTPTPTTSLNVKLYAWGSNASGQLGDGTKVSKGSPVQIGTGSGWIDIGGNAAITGDGRLFTWGDNTFGELGLGNTTSQSSPTQVGTDTNWRTVSVSRLNVLNHMLAVKTDDTLWVWGYNGNGELGDGTTTSRSSPVQITGGPSDGWSAVFAARNESSFGISKSGKLYAWGRNGNGELGLGDLNGRSVPTLVDTNSWKMVAAGALTTVAMRASNAIFSWGNNSVGQMGINSSLGGFSVPIQIGTNTYMAIAGGSQHFLGIRGNTSGTLWAWGYNAYGQLGDNSTINRSSPVQVGTGSNWVYVTCADNTSFALKTDGTLWSWGYGNDSTLGGGPNPRSSPVQIGALTDWKKIARGSFDFVIWGKG